MRLLSALVLAALLGRVSLTHAQTSDSIGSAITAAQEAAQSWLTLVDQTRYGASWDSAARVFRMAVTKSAWEDAVRSARRRFEPLGTRKLLGATFQTRLPNAPPGQYVVVQYRTGAGGERTVVETVTPMKERDGRWRVSGYYIRPQ